MHLLQKMLVNPQHLRVPNSTVVKRTPTIMCTSNNIPTGELIGQVN